jgi:site-specific DNA recombinase
LAEAPSEIDLQTLPVAFWGRTSTLELQDPTLSIPRQVAEVQEKMPSGCVITSYFWDIESGGLALEDRGRGRGHELLDVPVPREGGLQDLLREAASPDRQFAAVFCSDIARAARDSLYGLQLERDLEALGVPLLAADEPIVFDRSDPGTILFRRIKLGIAEWYRADIKRLSWNGMRTHTVQGWNSGRVPYGYLADKIPHPVPAKREEGKTKTRLVLDPDRAPVVQLIYHWRVKEQLGHETIRDRLNADLISYPPPQNPNPKQQAGVWTVGAVRHILANPKYTGFMVWNLRDSKYRTKDPSEWVWSAEPAHQAVISRTLFDQAAGVGRNTKGSRQGNRPNPHPMTRRTYLLRSRVQCGICGRRMIGHHTHGVTYYRCKTTHADPRTQPRFPDHPNSVEVREDMLHAAIEAFFAERVFGEHRLALFAQHFSEDQARAHATHARQVASLEGRLSAADRGKRKLLREIEAMPDDDELAEAMRADIRARYYEQEVDRRRLVAELDDLKAQQPPPLEDRELLAELPQIPVTLVGVPEDRQRDLFAAFALGIRYHKLRNEAELSVTLTDRLVNALIPTPDQIPESDDDASGVVIPLPRTPTLPLKGGGNEDPI